MRLFDLVLIALITACLAAVIVVFKNDAMPYPVTPIPTLVEAPRPRPWAGIWIHSSGTKRGSLASIDKAHAARGGAPFHFVVGNGTETPDGQVEESQLWRDQKPGLNPDVIEICLVGDLDHQRPTKRQELALNELAVRLCRERLISSSEIAAESEKKPGVACPGRFFDAERQRTFVRTALGK